MELISQKMRKLAPELDPLRIGTGWKKEDLDKVQVMVESTYGDSHPGSGHLNLLVEEVRKGIAEEGGYGARYFCTDICDGESQGTDGINYSLASREMIANMIEIHAMQLRSMLGCICQAVIKVFPGKSDRYGAGGYPRRLCSGWNDERRTGYADARTARHVQCPI